MSTLHLQEFSAVNVKGTTLKGKIPAIDKDVQMLINLSWNSMGWS